MNTLTTSGKSQKSGKSSLPKMRSKVDAAVPDLRNHPYFMKQHAQAMESLKKYDLPDIDALIKQYEESNKDARQSSGADV